MAARAHRPHAEGILAGWDQGKRHRRPARFATQMLRLQPCAEARIVNLRFALPEGRSEIALNLQVVQLQLDKLHFARKVAFGIAGADVQSSDTATFALNLDDHSACSIRLGGLGQLLGARSPELECNSGFLS